MTVPENTQYPDYQDYQPLPPQDAPKRIALPILELAGLLMVLGAIVLLAREFGVFKARPQVLPAESTIDGISVAGMTAADAEASALNIYTAPITVFYRDQALSLDPAQVDFSVRLNQPLAEAAENSSSFADFWDYLWLRPDDPVVAETIPTYSEQKLREWLAGIAGQYDQEALAGNTTVVSTTAAAGQSGRFLDVEASLPVVEDALLSRENRTAALVVRDEAAPTVEQPLGLTHLQEQIVQYLMQHQFRGVISFYVIDETTGEELNLRVDFRSASPQYLDCEVAYAGLSTMKIPIVLNYYRYLSWQPFDYEYDIVFKSLVESSNIMPNVMLSDISLVDDPKRGAYAVTESLRYLGLENSFIASAYDDDNEPEYFTTPAREAARTGTCVNTNPDIYMQTTAEDVAILLDMLYQCATHHAGDLIAAYSDEITPEECQTILDTMKQNTEGKLIRAGLPVDTDVAHKHGYTYDTISDSGVVWSPGGDYVLVMFIWEDVEWVATGAYPIMMDLSALTFNYFNPDLADVPRQGYGDVLEPEE